MFLSAALTVGGAVLLGLAARSEEKNPFYVLGGLALVGVALVTHFTTGGPWLQTLGVASAEIGAGLLIIAGMLAGRKPEARDFFTLGLAAMTVGVAMILIRSAFFSPTVSFLVELGPDDSIEEIAAVIAEYQGTAERAFPMVDLSENEDLAQVYIIRLPEKCREALRRILDMDTENVDHSELNIALGIDLPSLPELETRASSSVLENDPLVGSQWALDAIDAHKAHADLQDIEPARRAVVAIIDTGVDSRHEDMGGIFHDSPGGSDRHGHGTHCAGIAGAATNNGLGVASLNWEGRFVSITSYSALGDDGMGTLESTAEAVIEAAEAGADVISMSLGGQAPSIPKTMTDAIAYARSLGAVVIAAAGNANRDARFNVPSNVDGVIAVGALNEQLNKAPFSNTTAGLSRPIAAPGTNILSLKPTGGYVKLSGTSMATPMVAGLVGVMKAINPELSDQDIYRILLETGTSTAADRQVGRMINAHEALRAARDA